MNAPYHHGNLRQALLERAIEQLDEKGFENLSLRALARDLGVSHAAPLRHFATKAELLNAIAIEGVQSLLRATKAASEAEPGVARLKATTLAYVTWARDHAAFHRVIRNPDVMRHASDALKDLLSDFAGLQKEQIRQAQEGGWRTQVDPSVLFLHLVSLTAGTAIVVTDGIYQAPLGQAISHDQLTASISLFFDDAA